MEVAAKYRSAVVAAVLVLLLFSPALVHGFGGQQSPGSPSPLTQTAEGKPGPSTQPIAEDELQKGTALTRSGRFDEAIPHLLAARGRVSNEYAASFNLSLCYVATNQFTQAIQKLNALRSAGHDNADVNNLLAQAYIGGAQNEKALEALQRAANLTPTNEKLYLFVADACMSNKQFGLGIQVVDLGLQRLPGSAWLHYERGMFLSRLDQFDLGKKDFELAANLASGSDVAFVAGAQQKMFEGDVPQAIRLARDGVRQNHGHYLLLMLLGEALIRSGISPGQPEFAEARESLEKSIALRSNDAGSQIALGKLYLLENRSRDAIAHFEAARELDRTDPAIYSNLATAYRKRGDLQQAQNALAILSELNQAQAEKIRSAPGDRKAGYGSTASRPRP